MGLSKLAGRKDRAVRMAWANWMYRFPWTVFVSITYDPRRDKRWPRLGSEILGGGGWAHNTTGAVRSAMFTDPFSKLDGFHLHGLMYLPDWTGSLEPRMEVFEKRLKHEFGPSRVLPISCGGAAMYVTKHMGDLDREGIEVDLRGEDEAWVISD